MSRFLAALQSFNGGEWSRGVSSRSDLRKSRSALRLCENAIPLIQGGVRRRSGTRYVANTKVNGIARLVRFEYSSDQAYILEFGAGYIRFYKDEGQITSGGSPVEVTSTYTEAELFELQFTQSADTLYIFHQAHHPAKLVRSSHTIWTLSDVVFKDGPWLDMNAEAQSGSPRIQNNSITGSVTLTASGTYADGTAFEPFDATRDIGRLVRLAGASSGVPKGAGYARITAVASSTSATATVLGSFSENDTQWRWWLGAFYTDNYPACGTFAEGRLWAGSTPSHPQRIWGSRSGLFEDFGPDGDLSGTDSTSHVKYLDGDMTPYDDNGIDYTLGTDDVDAILWMKYAAGSLILGTQSGFHRVQGADGPITPSSVRVTKAGASGASAVAPEAIESSLIYASRTGKKILNIGYSLEADDLAATDLTALSQHVAASGVVQFAKAYEPHSLIAAACGNGQLAALTFMPAQEVSAWGRTILGGTSGSGDAVIESVASIPSTDLTHDQLWFVVKRTINGSTVRTIEFQEEDFRYNDEEQDIEEAFMVDCGLSLDGHGSVDPVAIDGITNASPAVVTAYAHGYSNGDHVRIRGVTGMTEVNHRAYAVANKTADTFELTNFAGTDIDSTDYGTYESGGTVRKMGTAISGLGHLEGETVTVVGDGSPQTSQVVIGGAITLATEAAEVHVGLPYTMRVVTQGIDPPTPNGGSLQGVKLRPDKVLIRCLDTVGGKVGCYGFNLDPFDLRAPSDPMTGPRQPSEIETMVLVDSDLSYQPEIEVRQDQPLPLTLLALFIHGNASSE